LFLRLLLYRYGWVPSWPPFWIPPYWIGLFLQIGRKLCNIIILCYILNRNALLKSVFQWIDSRGVDGMCHSNGVNMVETRLSISMFKKLKLKPKYSTYISNITAFLWTFITAVCMFQTNRHWGLCTDTINRNLEKVFFYKNKICYFCISFIYTTLGHNYVLPLMQSKKGLVENIKPVWIWELTEYLVVISWVMGM
jgi:hypothetical protein